MQNLSLSVNAPGLKKSPKVDPLLEAVEAFLSEAYSGEGSPGAKYSSPTQLSVSFNLELQSPTEPKVVATISFKGNWMPSKTTSQY